MYAIETYENGITYIWSDNVILFAIGPELFDQIAAQRKRIRAKKLVALAKNVDPFIVEDYNGGPPCYEGGAEGEETEKAAVRDASKRSVAEKRDIAASGETA